jgi:hypothetical protein
MDMDGEQWKAIPGYEGIYEASTHGRIRTAANKTTANARCSVRHWKQRILKQKYQARSTGKRDARVCLWKDGREKTFLVSRLVAMTWCAGYSGELTVNHIDGNPENNHAENLEWISLAENVRDGFARGVHPVKACALIDLSGERHEFASYAAASRWLGKSNGYISNTLKEGRTKINSYVILG